jgi:proteasome-associated ATPase
MKVWERLGEDLDGLVLAQRLRDTERELEYTSQQRVRATSALSEARERIAALTAEIEKLCAAPSTYGIYLSPNDDTTVNVLVQGRKLKVGAGSGVTVSALRPGQELILNGSLNVVGTAGYEVHGEVTVLKQRLDLERALITSGTDTERVAVIADPLRPEASCPRSPVWHHQ